MDTGELLNIKFVNDRTVLPFDPVLITDLKNIEICAPHSDPRIVIRKGIVEFFKLLRLASISLILVLGSISWIGSSIHPIVLYK